MVTAFIKKLSFVSTHSRPKAAGAAAEKYFNKLLGFNTQPPEGGWTADVEETVKETVSTHSRPKAAGSKTAKTFTSSWFQHTAARRRLVLVGERVSFVGGFNTQPPEGGWLWQRPSQRRLSRFNTQPPEGGWVRTVKMPKTFVVSTHSRPKAAGKFYFS